MKGKGGLKETQKHKRRMNSFIEKLLQIYCKMNHVKVEDIKSSSRDRGLPAHRHIFAYCIREHYSIRYWRIEKVLNKKQVRYGVTSIQKLLQFFDKNNTQPYVLQTRKRVTAFMEVCKKYERPDKIEIEEEPYLPEGFEELEGFEGFKSIEEFTEYIDMAYSHIKPLEEPDSSDIDNII